MGKESGIIQNKDIPENVALKSFFLGPRSENSYWVQKTVVDIFAQWFQWRNHFHPEDGVAITDEDQKTPEFHQRRRQMAQLIKEVSKRFEREIPKFSPRYVGHMLSDISLPALFGHIITLLHNPNNVTGESSYVGVEFEHEAVEELLNLVGFENGYGHFTSGGTIANYEGIVRARSRMQYWLAMGCLLKTKHNVEIEFFKAAHMGWDQYHNFIKSFNIAPEELKPWLLFDESPMKAIESFKNVFGEYNEPIILVPKTMHYSWIKGAKNFGFGTHNLWTVELDANGRLDMTDLNLNLKKAIQEKRPVLMVVSVCGTTEFGSIDPIDKVNAQLQSLKNINIHIWHHIDAAYGGFFLSMIRKPNAQGFPYLDQSHVLSPETCNSLKSIYQCESLTIDPHKLAYVPYSSGCFLVRDLHDYKLNIHEIPYLDFTKQSSRGLYTLEGSRSAAGSVATWLTAKSIGFDCDGYGRILEKSIENCRVLEKKLKSLAPHIKILSDFETNILCFCIGRSEDTLSHVNEKTLKTYEHFSSRQEAPSFYFSKTTVSRVDSKQFFDSLTQRWNLDADVDKLNLLRLCIMNPFFNSQDTQTNFPEELVTNLREFINLNEY